MKEESKSNKRSEEQRKQLKDERNPLNSIEFEDYRESSGCRDAYVNHTNADYEGYDNEYYEWN
jgi:hypothetical protein